ncbi:MAG: zinc-binding alcohol dehydrogenase family protein [Pseudonocardia sp.]|nr:zinc-binding alcohol dehydrogenase family protein [Pseudonocardia sp.]
MKAAVVEALGRPPRHGDAAEPVATGDMVVAEVRAAAVKNIERSLVAGSHYGSGALRLPGPIGLDAVVVLPDGRRVYSGATPPGGAMAERMLVNPDLAVEVPDEVDDAAAAALPNAAVSAWFALQYAGQIRPGQSVLVLGGTGVTGSVAAQLATHTFGADHVVVAGRDAARLERLAELGADTTITLGTDGDAEGHLGAELRRLHADRPFDLVLDYLWGRPAEQTLDALANSDLGAEFHRTRYVQVGAMAAATIELPAGVLRSAGIELLGQGGGSVPREAFGRVRTEILPALFAMLAEGSIAMDTLVRPLSEVTDAWTAPIPSGVRVVLSPDRVADGRRGPVLGQP